MIAHEFGNAGFDPGVLDLFATKEGVIVFLIGLVVGSVVG